MYDYRPSERRHEIWQQCILIRAHQSMTAEIQKQREYLISIQRKKCITCLQKARLIVDSSIQTIEARGYWYVNLKLLKEKNVKLEFCTGKHPSKMRMK